jgi:hypothetical protein
VGATIIALNHYAISYIKGYNLIQPLPALRMSYRVKKMRPFQTALVEINIQNYYFFCPVSASYPPPFNCGTRDIKS